jgi:glucose-1-phosphate cytidylyltransferase
MKVVILCGGLGTRLREETEFRPKPMVAIGSKPILWHIMKRFAGFGLREFVLCLGYKGEMIKEYFYHYELMNNDFTVELGCENKFCIHQTHSENGWIVTLANTGEKALKGARIKRIEKYIEDDLFLLTYGDGLTDIDIDRLVAFHKNHGKIVTISGVNPASRFGEMKIEDDKVISFREKPQNTHTIVNGGYMVLDKRIFSYLTDEDECDFEVGPLDQLAAEGQIMVYKHPGSWACMDTLRDSEYLNSLWNRNQAFWKNW